MAKWPPCLPFFASFCPNCCCCCCPVVALLFCIVWLLNMCNFCGFLFAVSLLFRCHEQQHFHWLFFLLSLCFSFLRLFSPNFVWLLHYFDVRCCWLLLSLPWLLLSMYCLVDAIVVVEVPSRWYSCTCRWIFRGGCCCRCFFRPCYTILFRRCRRYCRHHLCSVDCCRRRMVVVLVVCSVVLLWNILKR